jgi:multidrug efflux pump subunit AcrA (membrane-fusion protein)
MRLLIVHTCVCVLMLIWTAGCERGSHDSGHDHDHGSGHGHDHGEDGDHESEELEPGSVTLFTPDLQLFMQSQPLVAGRATRFAAHLTVLATGEPVRSGRLALQYIGPDGTRGAASVDAPARDGLFTPVVRLIQPGKYQAALVLQSPQGDGRIELGEWVVHADLASARKATQGPEEPEPADAVPFRLEQQWKIGLLLAEASPRSMIRRLKAPGRVELPTGAAAVVSSPAAGRLIRIEGGSMPKLGQTVRAGEALAAVELILPTTDAMQLQANRAAVQAAGTELALREMELQTKSALIDSAIAQSEARLELAQRQHDRIAPLSQSGIAAQEQMDRARAELRIAQAEHHAATESRRFHEDAMRRLEEWRRRIGGQAAEVAGGMALPLTSPIAGRIIEARHVEGERVEAGAAVYRVIDPRMVWIAASVSEFDLQQAQRAAGAVASFPAYPGRTFALDSPGGAAATDAVVDEKTRTITFRYTLANEQGLLKPGMFADVGIEIERVDGAVAIPQEAVVMDNGRAIGFVLLDGESFQKRELELGIRDGGYVQVIRGVAAGERVAARGAYAIKVAAAAPSALGHGHAH